MRVNGQKCFTSALFTCLERGIRYPLPATTRSHKIFMVYVICPE